MLAQMLHDGSYGAYSISSEGELKYDEKKDKKYFDSEGNQTEEQKALYDSMKERLIFERHWGQTKEGPLKSSYDNRSSMKFKAIADKYVVGSYTPLDKSLIGNQIIGRAFAMFNHWFISRITNAFEKGEYIKSLGDYKTYRDENGEVMVGWERQFVEGYLRTMARYVNITWKTKSLKHFLNMTPVEKRNFAKLGTTIGLYFAMYLLYTVLVDKDDDDDKPIPNWRLVRNMRYAYQSLLVLPTLSRTVNEPFAVFYILRNWLFNRNNEFVFNHYPGKATVTAFSEPLGALFTGDRYQEEEK